MQFKEDCNTEKKIIAKLKSSSERSLWAEQEDEIRCGLFDLIQVIRTLPAVKMFFPCYDIHLNSITRMCLNLFAEYCSY